MDKKPFAELNIQATYNLAYNASLMVREGLGSCIMLEKIINVPPYDPALCFRLLEPLLEDTLFIVWKRFQLFSKGTQQFIHLLKEEAEKYASYKTSLFNVFDKVSRYAADDSIRWDVPVHDGTGCDDGITADSDPSCYGRISPNPDAFMQDDPARHELTPFIRGWMMIERS